MTEFIMDRLCKNHHDGTGIGGIPADGEKAVQSDGRKQKLLAKIAGLTVDAISPEQAAISTG